MSSNMENLPQFEGEVTKEEVLLSNQNFLSLRLQVAKKKRRKN